MDDREVVAAIVAGDPTGLAEAYDRYAAGLYTYCRSLIREPADATAAVQDTFIIATAKLAELRDPGRLRPWLYAVARNECRRRLGTKVATSGLDEVLPTHPDAVNEPADASGDAERAELREALRTAITELNPSQQEVIELRLRHQLEGPDLADVLGVPRKQAHALLSGARAQLERSLGALHVARTGRQSCPDLDAMLDAWDGTLTELLRKRVNQHIERCETCGERRRTELHPTMLFSLMPLATVPVGFWPELLTICADDTPEAIAHRVSVVNHAGWFGSTGFPMPVDPPKPTGWRRSGRVRAAAAAAAAAVIATIAILTLSGARHSLGLAAGSSAEASAGSSPDGPSRFPAPAPRSGIPATVVPGADAPGSPAAPGSGATTTRGSRSPATSSSPTSSSSSAVSQGTLNVTPKVLVLTSASGAATGTFTLTAQNGPVAQYLITAPVLLVGA